MIYVYVSGFAPLDRRDAVWQQFKQDNPGITEVAQIGVVSDNTAAQVAEQAKAALQANPDVTAIFAPFDEFAKGAVQAVQELGLEDQVRVYGADISNADIAVMTAEGSPWVATSAADPSNVGAVAVRAAALLVGGRGRSPGHRRPAGTDHPGTAARRQHRERQSTDRGRAGAEHTRSGSDSMARLTSPSERAERVPTRGRERRCR